MDDLHFVEVKKGMREISILLNLPKNYRSDLELDLEIVSKYKGKELLWILRDNGSILLPLKCGINSVYCEYYADYDKSAHFLLIDTKEHTIKSVSKEKAIELINKPPTLDLSMPTELIMSRYYSILNYGNNFGFWNTLNSKSNFNSDTNIHDALSYFKRIECKPMIELSKKVINRIAH